VLYALYLLGRAAKEKKPEEEEKKLILELMMAHLVYFIQEHHGIKIVELKNEHILR
jgi:hydrogenase-4 membrane subunit HyfE